MTKAPTFRSARIQRNGPGSILIRHSRPQFAASTQASRMQLAGAIYDWITCIFVAVMVTFQFLGVIAGSVDNIIPITAGQDPKLGPHTNSRTNDVPYSDRALVCVAKDDTYIPMQLSEMLTSGKSSILRVHPNASPKAGFRVIERYGLLLDSAGYENYARVCQIASTTLEGIFYTCQELGYDVVKDGLRIVHGADSNITILLQGVLPFLILPFSDNGVGARYALPGWDGSACIVRLTGKYVASTSTVARVGGLERAPRESRTIEWLQRPGGKWRHGWYEDLEGDRWYSFMSNAGAGSKYLPPIRSFDGETHEELVCLGPVACNQDIMKTTWGPRFVTMTSTIRATSVVVYNATQFGMFFYDGAVRTSVRSVYDWKMAVSNISIALLIFRWIIALAALQRSYFLGKGTLRHIGIGALSNAPSFVYLPLILLPRLDIILSAFFTIGCDFQGGQAAFSNTWFVIYPSNVELMLVFYSIMNLIAKVTRRRVSDTLFAPTVLGLSLLHFFRKEVAKLSWFNMLDNSISTLVSSDEIAQLKLYQFFTSDIALRLNGNNTKILAIKCGILALNLVPLVIARTLPARKDIRTSLYGVEKALGVRAFNVGGLGRSLVYEMHQVSTMLPHGSVTNLKSMETAAKICPEPGELGLNSYELVRLGYIVYGNMYLISLEDWDRVSMLIGFRSLYHLWNHRVVVFSINLLQGTFPVVDLNPILMRVDAPELLRIRVWDISVYSIKC